MANPITSAISTLSKPFQKVASGAAGVLSFLTKSEQGFGQTLGDTAAVLTGTSSGLLKQHQHVMDQATQMYNEAQKLKPGDPKRTLLLQQAVKLEASIPDPTQQLKSVIPSTQKSTKQILGEAGGTLLDTVAAGSFGGKTAEGAATVSKGVKVAKTLAAGTALGAGYGATSAMQDNKSGKDIAKGAAIGAGVGLATAGLSLGAEVVSQKLKSSAFRSAYEALGPTTKKNKAIANAIVPEILDRHIVATEGGLNKLAQQGIKTTGEAMDELGRLTGKTNAADLISSLQKEVTDGISITTEAGSKVLPSQQGTLDHLSPLIADIKSLTDKDGNISNEALQTLKQVYAKQVEKAGGVYGKAIDDTTKLGVLKDTAATIREHLASTNPDRAALNKEYHFYQNLQTLIDAKSGKLSKGGSLFGKVAGGVVAGTRLAAGDITGAVELGSGMKIIDRIVGSTGWKLLSAQTKNAIADALTKGNDKELVNILIKRMGPVKLMQSIMGPSQPVVPSPTDQTQPGADQGADQTAPGPTQQFDYSAAKGAGLTDDDIVGQLNTLVDQGQQIEIPLPDGTFFDYSAARADGASDQDLASMLSQLGQ